MKVLRFSERNIEHHSIPFLSLVLDLLSVEENKEEKEKVVEREMRRVEKRSMRQGARAGPEVVMVEVSKTLQNQVFLGGKALFEFEV